MSAFLPIQQHATTHALPLILASGLLTSLLLAGCSGSTEPTALTGLHAQDAYIKRAVPGRKMTAAYATLINYSTDALCFVGFEADFATRVELHVTEPVGGPNSQRVAMRRIHEQCVSPGEQLTLAPGGKHLMIMGFDEAALGAQILDTPSGSAQSDAKPANTASDNPNPPTRSQPAKPLSATIRLGTSTGRLFAVEFAVVPFNYSPQNL